MPGHARLLVVAALVLSFRAGVAPAELIDNPQYVSWSKQTPGTKVSVKNETVTQGMTIAGNITSSLVEVTAEKAVVEATMKMDVPGMNQEQKRTNDVPAKIEKGSENMPPNVKGSAKELANESIEIAGKSYDCKVTEFTGETPQGKVSGKVWSTTEIPGALAKMEMKIDGGPVQATTTMLVTAIEKK